jgi:hypothetical protein
MIWWLVLVQGNGDSVLLHIEPLSSGSDACYVTQVLYCNIKYCSVVLNGKFRCLSLPCELLQHWSSFGI